MEPYSWAHSIVKQMTDLRADGSPYAFVCTVCPEWTQILRELLASSGIAEAWIHSDNSCVMVRFPENAKHA